MSPLRVVNCQDDLAVDAGSVGGDVRVFLTLKEKLKLREVRGGTALVAYREFVRPLGRDGTPVWELRTVLVQSSGPAVNVHPSGVELGFAARQTQGTCGFVDTQMHGCMVMSAYEVAVGSSSVWVGLLRPESRDISVSVEKNRLQVGNGQDIDVLGTIDSPGDHLDCLITGRANDPSDVELIVRRRLGAAFADSPGGDFGNWKSLTWQPVRRAFDPIVWVYSDKKANARDLRDGLIPMGYTGGFEYGPEETFVIGDSPEMEYAVVLRHSAKHLGIRAPVFEDMTAVRLGYTE